MTSARLQQLMKTLGESAKTAVRVFLVGGATSVLLGWRDSTIDVDLKIVPESDEVLRKVPELKERLQINIELASPDDFIPELPGWQERSSFVRQENKVTFFHYDFYAQALAKIERGHTLDMQDLREMINRGLIEPERLLDLFDSVEDQLYRYPAIDASSFRRRVEAVARGAQPELIR